MGDSDDEFDRRRGRDKFRRERNDYERRDDRRGAREPWDDRNREWGSRSRERRADPYDRNRRDSRYSPQPRHEMSPPHMKRMRRDWDEGGGGGFGGQSDFHYGGGGGGGGGPPHGGAAHGGWTAPGPGDGPPAPGQQPGFGGPGAARPPEDFPTQPAMQTFKQFLTNQDDNITDEDAIKKYNEYKMDFKKQQINEFFVAHKDEEWFRSKYHPEECDKRKDEARNTIKGRCSVFTRLIQLGRVDKAAVDLEHYNELVKLLDAAVIVMEGGREFDMEILDMPEAPRLAPPLEVSKPEPESPQTDKPAEVKVSPEKMKTGDEEDGELEDENKESQEATAEKPEATENEENGEVKEAGEEGEENPEPKPEIKENGEMLNNGPVKQKKKKKRRERNYDENYESGSDSESGSFTDSDSGEDPGAPGNPDSENSHPAGTGADPSIAPVTEEGEADPEAQTSETAPGDEPSTEEPKKAEEENAEEKERDTTEAEDLSKPRAFHKTNSIFLRNLAPTITKLEVEAICKKYPGFLRVALQDPMPERRFSRRGWVTFDRTVNIKQICWDLNNIRLRDCEMGAIVNRELKQRIRPVNGIVCHKQIAKQDVKLAAKIVQNLDEHWKLFEEEEKKDKGKDEKKQEKEQQMFGLVSRNPVLKNITDFLVDEGDYEEEAYFDTLDDQPKEANPQVAIEKDEQLLKVLDRMILYLRIVHSLDYYSAVEYPNEDEMPHKCGIMHGRGNPPPNRIPQNEINDWMGSFEMKMSTFTNLKLTLSEEEAVKLGKKDHAAEIEKFITANTQELAKDKWLCPISGKKFKGPEFVRKHILNKHEEKVVEVEKEVAYFNNYLGDCKRPQLPEHPSMRQGPPPGPRDQGAYNMHQGGGGGGYPQGPPQHQGYQPRGGGHMGYQGNRGRGNWRGGGFKGHYQQNYHQRSNSDPYRTDRRPPQRFPRRDRSRADPRGIIEYRDLDAPEDMDTF